MAEGEKKPLPDIFIPLQNLSFGSGRQEQTIITNPIQLDKLSEKVRNCIIKNALNLNIAKVEQSGIHEVQKMQTIE